MPDLHPLRTLFWKILLINVAGTAVVGAAAVQGWVAPLFLQDGSRLSFVIAAVFVAAIGLSTAKAAEVSLLGRRPIAWTMAEEHAYARLLIQDWLSYPRYLTNMLTMLGLIGCVIGFSMVTGSLDQQAIGDPGAIAGMVGTLFAGMATAMHTTLLGCVLWVWASLVYRVLESGGVSLLREARGV